VHDLDVRDELANGLGDLADRDTLLADEAVGAIRGVRREHCNDPAARSSANTNGRDWEPSPASVSGLPARAFSTKAASTVAGRECGPYGIPKRRTVYSRP
jgi:hypothetical protein